MDAPARPLDARDRALLLGSAVFALAYLVHALGLVAPYPIDVCIKGAGIVLLGVLAGRRGHVALAIALCLGAAGDVFLELRPVQMTLGIAAFGLGHAIYLALFIRIGRRDGARGGLGWIGAGLLAVLGLALLIWLQPHFGELRGPASVYNGLIIGMACVALGVRSPTLAWAGALAFVASDTILAMRLFVGLLPWAGPVVWVSYWLGQVGLALGLSQPLGAAPAPRKISQTARG